MFEVKAKITNEKGKKTTFNIIAKAVSHTDAEAKVNESLTGFNFEITGIKPSKISEIWEFDYNKLTFKVKFKFDGAPVTVLLSAEDLDSVPAIIRENLKTAVADWNVVSISAIEIMEVIH